MQLLLQDTAGMEKRGGVGTMTKTYFRQAVGVILVYDTSNLESLLKIKTWVEAAEETCVYSQHLIYTLWGNEKGSMYSSVNNPVEPDHLSALLAQLQSTLAKPIHIEDQLVCKMDATNQAAVTENYEILVRSIHRKVKEIDTVMKEASQRITLERPNVVENEEEMGQSRRCISSCWTALSLSLSLSLCLCVCVCVCVYFCMSSLIMHITGITTCDCNVN